MTTTIPSFVNSELERLALDELVRRLRHEETIPVLDIPCGDGQLAAFLATRGADVTACDTPDHEQSVHGRALAHGQGSMVHFFPCTDLLQDDLPVNGNGFDMAICRHGLHDYPYDVAKQVIRRLLKSLKVGGKLFLSAYGLHSPLGYGYAHELVRVQQRFAELEPKIAQDYGLNGKVCLYTERDLVLQMFEAGGSVVRSFTTTHGSVGVVAVRM